MNNRLSIIIPFLNEGEEVENTVKSIRQYCDRVDIILINDASSDSYDYESVAKKYGAIYIVNKERLGVAASRDKGINISPYPYFLLLDAHMRFYDSLWADKIIHILENNERTILCCQTKILGIEEGIVVERNLSTVYAAYIDFCSPNNILGASWTSVKYPHSSNQELIPVACILGAGYACTKKYWQYLNGLNGLMFYGSDETYISLKAWLEGGKCLLLTNVIIGHVYRTQFPYHVENLYTCYNRMLIAELLLPRLYAKRVFSLTKTFHLITYNKILFLLKDNEKQILQLKLYYKQILKKDFDDFLNLNNLVQNHENKAPKIDDILEKIASSLASEYLSVNDIGLVTGRMGIVIFLFHYAKYSRKAFYQELAKTMTKDLINELHINQSLGLYSGLLGVGWGLEYLHQNGFIEENGTRILEQIDKKTMDINLMDVSDMSVHNGLGGAVHYILARLCTSGQGYEQNLFNEYFLNNLYLKIKSIIDNRIDDCDSIDIFIKFIEYFDSDSKTIEKPMIYDIIAPQMPKNYETENHPMSLNGSAGIGLMLIFDKKFYE
jgi:glycosyltransferase involved in cell wall biosynthesis